MSECLSFIFSLGIFSYGIAAIAPFSHRLAFDDLSEDIQRLRCKVNFQALTFVPHINSLGEVLVKRLRQSVHSGSAESGKFAVLHLRFDKVIRQLCL